MYITTSVIKIKSEYTIIRFFMEKIKIFTLFETSNIF